MHVDISNCALRESNLKVLKSFEYCLINSTNGGMRKGGHGLDTVWTWFGRGLGMVSRLYGHGFGLHTEQVGTTTVTSINLNRR